ncbi:MAG: hypothetical protein EOP48_29330 [Sphingobacteriales bacterium]|nr:MAG: hypothetical protein EOP48_29330 [Sphingobacteriales bacterium]
MENVNTRFSKNIQASLLASGWFEGRSADITNTISLIRDNGMEVFLSLELFLKEFDKLRVETVIDGGIEKVFLFDVYRGIKELKYLEFLPDFKEAIGCKNLGIIGYANTDWTILIDENYGIYIVDTQNINFFGTSDIGIENLLSYGDCKKVALPDWWWDKY